MNFLPGLEDVKRIASSGEYHFLPVSCEMLSDICTPMEALKILKNVSTHCYMLESVGKQEKWGRYTFLGFDPKLEITCIDGELKAGDITFKTDNPSVFLRQILKEHKSPRFDYLPTFTGGLVGYFSYDYLGYSEPTVKTKVQDSEAFEGSLLNTYRILRTMNPSPYMFYFSGTDVEVAGASPETLVKLENGILHTFPLTGTRPRGKTDEEDLALERGLLSDEKELAEHNMLVDLGRNDLGKISKFGTVAVEKLHSIERYSHVMHIGSTVRGEIRDEFDALDAVSAVLPAGTLSGAPKIRACQLIGELENNKRGIYGGAIGYIDFTGNMDTCIAIRIAYKKNGRVFIRSGAGIVADSVPEKEFEECINKAKAVVNALKLAEKADL